MFLTCLLDYEFFYYSVSRGLQINLALLVLVLDN